MSDAPQYWLMKTEPDVFSFDDLLKAPRRTTSWEGVRNYQVRNLMRDVMRIGDLAFIYHSSCAVPGVVGIARISSAPHADLTALDPKSPYFDALSQKQGASRWLLVDVKAEQRLTQPVSLAAMRQDPSLVDLPLLKRGNRLSIQSVPQALWERIVELGKPRPV